MTIQQQIQAQAELRVSAIRAWKDVRQQIAFQYQQGAVAEGTLHQLGIAESELIDEIQYRVDRIAELQQQEWEAQMQQSRVTA